MSERHDPNADRENPTEMSGAEARQGSVSGRVNTVHIVSGVLGVGALLLIWIIFAFVLT